MKNDSLKLDMFFPDELLSTTSVNYDDNSIHIKMRSKTHSSKCPECGQETQIYHGTYLRKVQDLPILGKTARLQITLIVKVVVSKNLYSCFDRLSDIVLYLT